jgi:hypothetical protein
VIVRARVWEVQGCGGSDVDDEDMDAERDEGREQYVGCQSFHCTRHSTTPAGRRAYGKPYSDRRRCRSLPAGHSEHARTGSDVGCRDAQSFDIQDSGIHDMDMGCVGRAGGDARAECGGMESDHSTTTVCRP